MNVGNNTMGYDFSWTIEKLKKCQASDYASATPFPLVVIDDFLPEDFLDALHLELADLVVENKTSDYVFAKNKYETPNLASVGAVGAELENFLLSDEFRLEVSRICGQTIFLDPLFTGGGVHRGGAGSYLDMHADFKGHPSLPWRRELNLLLYLNKDWKESYGGQLKLRNPKTGERRLVDPIDNRMVIMLTDSHTLHGYDVISFPEGVFRTSIAAYAYSLIGEAEHAKLRTTTVWRPSKGAFRKLVSIFSPPLVMLKQRLLGSSTVKKSKR